MHRRKPNGEVDPRPWCRGFYAAMRLRMSDWAPLLDTSDVNGLAHANGVVEHGLEHRLERAGRPRDDVQHLRGGGPLFQRLGELLFQIRVRCAKAVNISASLRSGRRCSTLARESTTWIRKSADLNGIDWSRDQLFPFLSAHSSHERLAYFIPLPLRTAGPRILSKRLFPFDFATRHIAPDLPGMRADALMNVSLFISY